MKAMPPLTSRILIQDNLSFPLPDSGYTTVVRHRDHQLYRIKRRYSKRQNFRIYRTVVLLVILNENLSSRFYSVSLIRRYVHIFK